MYSEFFTPGDVLLDNVLPDDALPGDVLSIFYWGVDHLGLYIGNGLVIHNSKKKGCVCCDSISDFADGRDVKVSETIVPKDRSLSVQRAKAQLGKQYNLWRDNCEHFVRYCCGRVKESKQLQIASGVLAALAVGGAGYVAYKKIKKKG